MMILKFVTTAVLSLFIFGFISIVFPMILAYLSKVLKRKNGTDSDGSDLYVIVLFLLCGFLLSALFHSFEFFYPTVALLTPMIYMGMGILNNKSSIKEWLPVAFYLVGWFLYLFGLTAYTATFS